MSISENIKELRELHNLSQKELAEIAGVTDKAVSTWENGTKEPRMGAIQKIADYFGLKKSNLIEENGLHLDFSTQKRPQPVSARQKKLDAHFNALNDLGQEKALDYVADLSDNPKYAREPYVPTLIAAHNENSQLSEADQDDIARFIREHVAPKKNS